MNARYRLIILSIIFVFILYKTYQFYGLVERDESDLTKVEAPAIQSTSSEKILVTVYYEALCSDSRNFILKHLLPTYTLLSDHMTLDLVPYGKAKTIETDNGNIEFECQHMAAECLGNKIHSCAIDQIIEPMLQLKMVACMIDDGLIPLEAAERCAHENGVSYGQLVICANDKRSSILLRTHGERTKAVRPAITFIPTIELDGSQNVPLPKILKDFKKELCNSFKEIPKECL